MPEHTCPTAATAFKILEETRQYKVTELKEHERRLLENDPVVVGKIRQKLIDELKSEKAFLQTDECMRLEDRTNVLYAGQRFKFDSYEAAVDFMQRRRKDVRVNLDLVLHDAATKGLDYLAPEKEIELGKTRTQLRRLMAQGLLAEKGQA